MKHKIENVITNKINNPRLTKKDVQSTLSMALKNFALDIGLYPNQRSSTYVTLHEQLYKEINKLSNKKF